MQQAKVIGGLLIIFLLLTTYTTIKTELNTRATGTTTNAFYRYFNDYIGLIWVIMVILFIGFTLYYAFT